MFTFERDGSGWAVVGLLVWLVSGGGGVVVLSRGAGRRAWGVAGLVRGFCRDRGGRRRHGLRQAGFDGDLETRISVLERGTHVYATTEEVSR